MPIVVEDNGRFGVDILLEPHYSRLKRIEHSKYFELEIPAFAKSGDTDISPINVHSEKIEIDSSCMVTSGIIYLDIS